MLKFECFLKCTPKCTSGCPFHISKYATVDWISCRACSSTDAGENWTETTSRKIKTKL